MIANPRVLQQFLVTVLGWPHEGNLEPSMHALQWVRQVWQHQIL